MSNHGLRKLRAVNLSVITNRSLTLHALRLEPSNSPCFNIDTKTEVPRLYLRGVIGGFEDDSNEFVQQVHALDADQIDVYVNSPGGLYYDAVAMYEALDEHPATVNVHVDGLAASAASIVVQAGATRRIAKGSRMMVHDAQGVGIGSPDEMREYADQLDAVSDDIASYYAERAGGKPEAWRATMKATTWYSAAEAVASGLADQVTGGKKNAGPDNRTRLIQARHRALTTQGG